MNKIFDDQLLSISEHTYADEKLLVGELLARYPIDEAIEVRLHDKVAKYIKKIREAKPSLIESFMREYSLSTEEGVAIMCIAEALLRIPDENTAYQLIKDKILNKDWRKHSKYNNSLFVNASAWGLFLTGKIMKFNEHNFDLMKLVSRLGGNMTHRALRKAVELISSEFIMGDSIENGVKRAAKYEKQGYAVSYDILGESSRNAEQVEHYYSQYLNAVKVISVSNRDKKLLEGASLSVKISALHARFELLQSGRLEAELIPRVANIVKACMENNIAITFDAEEATRLDIYLIVLSKLISSPEFAGYNGIGFVIQAYQKRAYKVIEFIIRLAEEYGKQIPVRLVKGAYWDSEIKKAQELGLKDYPVFTSKEFTDISYLVCAKKMWDNRSLIYPQFATHNAYTIAAIQQMVGEEKVEFQKLQGMGSALHQILNEQRYVSRIYSPVGKYADLLAYLMRRLLENGANTSFVNIVYQEEAGASELTASLKGAAMIKLEAEETIEKPDEIFKSGRINSRGYDLGVRSDSEDLRKKLLQVELPKGLAPEDMDSEQQDYLMRVHNPAEVSSILAMLKLADSNCVQEALAAAHSSFESWAGLGVKKRAEVLLEAAKIMEAHRYTIYLLLIQEGGKNIKDSIGEVREAIDFARYYAEKAIELMDHKRIMDGYTGEFNTLSLHPRGVFVCISPWNFPLAIFCGQIFASLVTGNTVVAKPSEHTPMVALYCLSLLEKAGVPKGVLNLLIGDGRVGAELVKDNRVAGVCFTGSTKTSRLINQALAARSTAIAPLIAETGGQNSMIVDSSALMEQVTDDVVTSAFGSTGQRCSALRVLYIQEEIFGPLVNMINGAMQELKIGPTMDFENDLGPVISAAAKASLENHIKDMESKGFEILAVHHMHSASELASGHFVVPYIIKINHINDLRAENFGPILHVKSYKIEELDSVIAEINSTGFGLTCGIQSRIEKRFNYIAGRIKVGNIYINRSTIGAQVESHPFGGEGESGTGFKAGGPHYLLKFLNERMVTLNTTAIGGNLQLLLG